MWVEVSAPARGRAKVDGSALATVFARLVVACAAATVAIIGLGALMARPIADDYTVNARLVTAHGALPAFAAWMKTWTGYYSEYGILTGLASATRAIGLERYTFAIASVAFLALCVVSVRACVRVAQRHARTEWGMTEALVLAAGLVGALAGPLRQSLHTNLYEAFFWTSSYISHLVPIVACPLLMLAVLRVREPRLRAEVAFVAAVFVAGFGLAETVVVAAVVAATVWVAYRVRGRAVVERHHVDLVATALGLASGVFIVESVPGTELRAHFFEQVHRGVTVHHGLLGVARVGASYALSDAKGVLISPAPVLGIFLGLAFCLTPVARARGAFAELVPTLMVAAWAVVGAALVAVALGDVYSYPASWHLLPLATALYVACFLAGYALGLQSRAELVPLAIGAVLVLAFAWTAVQTANATHVAWSRARVIDDDVQAVHAARASSPPRRVTWRSMSVGDMADAASSGPNAYVRDSVSQWLGIPSEDLAVVAVDPPSWHLF